MAQDAGGENHGSRLLADVTVRDDRFAWLDARRSKQFFRAGAVDHLLAIDDL